MSARRSAFRFAVVLALLVLTAASAGAWPWNRDRIDGSGDLETRSFDLDDFHAIELEGSLDVFVTMGERQSVEITLDDNLFDNLELEVHGSTLHVGWEKSCDADDDSRLVLVLPRLDELELSGAGDVRIDGYRGDRFEFAVNGAGDLDMSGTVDELEISISGAGDVDTRDLEARAVRVDISGAGDADVRASESLHASVSGVGDITYYGDPDEVSQRVSGIGRIHGK